MKKRVLATGKSSYVATSLKAYVEAHKGEQLELTLLSVRDEGWRQLDFGQYDVLLHCAGIVHQKERNVPESEYDRVNRRLTVELAQKAKCEGVSQFIFISTMNVYGMETGVITMATEPQPRSLYGRTNLQAEQELQKLADEGFRVCILRPPMIYGKGAKGNYPRLAMLAKKLPIFPDINNERSMLYIENLCEFITVLAEHEAAGLFFPQNKEYVRTSEMVRQIAECHGRRIKFVRIFNPVIQCLSGVSVVKKVFGSLVYEKSMSGYEGAEYRIRDFAESVKRSEE